MTNDDTRVGRKFSNEVKRHFLEIVSTYSKYQEQIDRKSDISKIAETLGGITEAARELALNEADDWFDAHTVKRNMKELEKLGKDFDKVAVESKSLDERLHGLYEDMGHILSRYYKVGELTEDEVKSRLGMNEGKSESRQTAVAFEKAILALSRVKTETWINNQEHDQILKIQNTLLRMSAKAEKRIMNESMNKPKKSPCSCGCGTCDSVLTENKLMESAMGELQLLAKESNTFQIFQKSVYREFPNLPKTKDSVKWLESLYNTNESINETKFIAFYNNKQHEIEGKDLWDAKKKAIAQLKIPKSKQGLLSIKSSDSMKNQDFRYENILDEIIDEVLAESREIKVGTKLTHKHDKNISIELISTTNRGWKVKQTEPKGPRSTKTTTQHYDSQDISGDKSLFESIDLKDFKIGDFVSLKTKTGGSEGYIVSKHPSLGFQLSDQWGGSNEKKWYNPKGFKKNIKLSKDVVKYKPVLDLIKKKALKNGDQQLGESLNEDAKKVWKKNGKLFVDSDFVNFSKGKLPGNGLKHAGYGDFYLDLVGGVITFMRHHDKFDGMSGRSHTMSDDKGGKLMAQLIKKMGAKIIQESINENEGGTNSASKLANKLNTGNETKFYDALTSLEEKMGFKEYQIWLTNALKGYGSNRKTSNQGETEEELFLISK